MTQTTAGQECRGVAKATGVLRTPLGCPSWELTGALKLSGFRPAGWGTLHCGWSNDTTVTRPSQRLRSEPGNTVLGDEKLICTHQQSPRPRGSPSDTPRAPPSPSQCRGSSAPQGWGHPPL